MTVHLLWVHYMIGELFPKYQSGAKRMYVPINSNSLLCGPISPVVNLEMSSTARFFVWKCNIWVLVTRKLPDAKIFIHSNLRN